MPVSEMGFFFSVFWWCESVINVISFIFKRFSNHTKLRFQQNKPNIFYQPSSAIFLYCKEKQFPVHSFKKEYHSRVEYFDYYIKIQKVCFTYFLYPEVNLNLLKWLSQKKKLYQSSDTDAMKKYWIFLLGVKFSSTSFYLTKIFKLLILSLHTNQCCNTLITNTIQEVYQLQTQRHIKHYNLNSLLEFNL